MKGSSISVRIADFLKDYPPFQYLDQAALRELASLSKVTFHEDGEIVFAQGQPRTRWLYVIQKGSVRIVEEGDGTERLIDLRGPGDLLGLQGIRSEEPYLHTGRTETETILYGLPRDEFLRMVEPCSRARRYLAAYFSLNPAYSWGQDTEEERNPMEQGGRSLSAGGLWEVEEPQSSAREIFVAVERATLVGEAARILQNKRVHCVVVVDEMGRPIGKLTDADLRDRVAEGDVRCGQPVEDILFTDIVTAGPRESTGDLLLKLARSGKHFAVITEDGSVHSRAVGLVSERDLLCRYAGFPTIIGEAINSAPDIGALRNLRDRLEGLILEFIHNRGSLVWLMEMVGVLNRKLCSRVVDLAVASLVRDGHGEPPCAFSWLMMGSGGRDELLIRSAVYHALVFQDVQPDQTGQVEAYFRELASRAAALLRRCGFLESPQQVLAQNPDWCLPLSAMKQRFTDMIARPVAEHVYSARDAFDFQPLSEDGCFLAESLSEHIDESLRAHPDFIRHMANDSLMNQPPRTIFRGHVVDRSGIRTDELAIKSHALLPLVDVARVLSLESGQRRPTGTYKRLRAMAERLGLETAQGTLFVEAAEAFMVAQFARISQGLRTGTDGAVIHPSELDPQTRTLLITSFRTIFDVLEVTAARFNLTWRG
jgi:CBS domain-containing protein